MSVKVITRSVCDVCGAVSDQEGANGSHPSPRWATLTLHYRAEPTPTNHGWGERIERVLCPNCADRVEAVVARGGSAGDGGEGRSGG